MHRSYPLRGLNELDLVRDKALLEGEEYEYSIWSSELF
jgi:hypothetical protein